MKCDEAGILLHALIDNELDAGHIHEVEGHIAACATCATHLREFRELHDTLSSAQLRYAAPASLRRRIESALPASSGGLAPTRRAALRGFGIGAVASALAASGAFVMLMRADDQQRILGDVVSAHLRSLQSQHLTDVESSDQHTVKPWFSGRLEVSPPVVDLSAQGFTLLGGRLDYVDAKPVAAIVYRRRRHIINLFCAPAAEWPQRSGMEELHGFNVWRRNINGMSCWAVSDLNAEELAEFGEKFEAAVRQ
jgi:anti-sigma factor RsiW